MLAAVKKAVCSFWRPLSAVSCSSNSVNYSSQSDFKTESPYKARRGVRRFYKVKWFTGGILPRPEGKWENKPLPMPKVDPVERDSWTRKKALFGQNDYIDILGDGSIHPWELITAPSWLKGYRGNELQRISRQLAFQGTFLRDTFPSKYHSLVKQMMFSYKRLNRRHHAPYWGGYRRYSRIDKPVL